MPPDPPWRDLNQSMWNAKTPLHLNSDVYDIPGFKAGRMTLKPHEIIDLGNVTGQRLIHLQCHFGLDTLSWARRGARATGLDFSEPATKAATELARDLGIEADFVTSDVYDASAAVSGRTYDIVYTGIGALCWLPDMERWSRVVHDLLHPGGQLYLFEFHPFKWMIEDSGPSEVTLRDSYFTPLHGYTTAGGVTYADSSIPAAATPTVQWNHPLGEVVTALVRAGLQIDSLRELDGDVMRQWDMMVRGEDRLYRMPPDRPSLPLMYILRAHRPD